MAVFPLILVRFESNKKCLVQGSILHLSAMEFCGYKFFSFSLEIKGGVLRGRI